MYVQGPKRVQDCTQKGALEIRFSVVLRIFFGHRLPGFSKVISYLQYAKAACCTQKVPLFVNMDETSVSFAYAKGKGLIISKRALPPGRKHKRVQVSPGDEKSHISFLAFITHNKEAQPFLPQIFLGNEHVFTIQLLQQLAPHIPGNFKFVRGKSGWNSIAYMRTAICLLAKSLESFAATHQIVLVLDVAGCHYHRTISTLATQKGIRLLYVPAKCTFLLQPCDTACFSRLKFRLRQKWLSMRALSSTGTVSKLEWLCAVIGIVSALLSETPWEPAFQAVGLLNEALLSPRIMGQLGWQSPRDIPDVLPSEEQLKLIFPRKAKFSRPSLFRWAVPVPKAKAKAKAKAMAVPAAMAALDSPFLD